MKRGGFREVISRGMQGLIELELQFRLTIADKERLVTYRLEIGEELSKPYVAREKNLETPFPNPEGVTIL